MEENYKFIYSGPLLYQSSLLKEDISNLLNLCKKHKKISLRDNLAGVINEEFKITDHELIMEILDKYMDNFYKIHSHWYGIKPFSVSIDEAWTNFMKANEYNPPHIHNGSNFSSVFYLNVPEKIAKEHKNFKGKGTKPGQIVFHLAPPLQDYLSSHKHTPVTGDFFIFPSKLIHHVNPFKSKVTRISMAINFNFRI